MRALALAFLVACSSAEQPQAPAASTPPGADRRETQSPGPSSPDAPAPPPQEGEGAPPARFVDSCVLASAACTPPPAGFAAGSGLAPVDRCAHVLTESAGLGAPSALVDALAKIAPRVTIADVLADANRDAVVTSSVPGSPPGVQVAFRWNAEDDASTRWIPQGLSGSPDATPGGALAGKRILLSSAYDAIGDKGVRVAFVDATSPTAPRYRLALLVVPSGSASTPSFDAVPIHAGGIVWFGSYLYVADTRRGFRVFDMNSILRVATDQDVVGCDASACRAGLYKYVVPQVGRYEIASVSAACEPLFSFVSLDRSSTPPSLVSGEYCSGSACSGPLAGRVFRWPLDPATGLLRSARTFPTEAFFMGQTQVQGAAARDGTFYLSSSAPSGGGGALYRVRPGKSATSTWIDTPEDLMVDAPSGLLWSQSEGAGARVVFGASLASHPPP